MRLSQLIDEQAERNMVDVFAGYNHNIRINGRESVTMHLTRGTQTHGNQTQTYEMHVGQSLGIMSENLTGLTIEGISQTEVELSNGQTKHVGDEFTADIYSTSYQAGHRTPFPDRAYAVQQGEQD